MDQICKQNQTIKFENFYASDGLIKTKFIQNPRREIYNFQELKKTKFELETIRIINKAYRKIFLQLKMLNVYFATDPDYIHVGTKQHFNQTFKDKSVGRFSFGHMYICKTDERWDIVNSLAHEIAHNLSYYKIMLTRINSGFRISLLQSGLQSSQYLENRREPITHFDGVNEATTEMMALIAREYIARETKLLSPSEKQKMLANISYREQIAQVNDLLKSSRQTNEAAKIALFRAYLNGNNFISALNKINPKFSLYRGMLA
jgi:hypothetical protein